MEDKTVAGLLGLIQADRNGEAVDKTLLKHLVGMFTSLGTYASAFEEAFLEKTKQYYSLEGQHFMQESDVADYLLHCEVWALSVCASRVMQEDRDTDCLVHSTFCIVRCRPRLSVHHVWQEGRDKQYLSPALNVGPVTSNCASHTICNSVMTHMPSFKVEYGPPLSVCASCAVLHISDARTCTCKDVAPAPVAILGETRQWSHSNVAVDTQQSIIAHLLFITVRGAFIHVQRVNSPCSSICKFAAAVAVHALHRLCPINPRLWQYAR